MGAGEKNSRLLRLSEVLARASIGRTAAYELIARGAFPPPVKVGSRMSRWIEWEVQAWIEQLAEGRKLSRHWSAHVEAAAGQSAALLD
jgi:prophage regulatory protein